MWKNLEVIQSVVNSPGNEALSKISLGTHHTETVKYRTVEVGNTVTKKRRSATEIVRTLRIASCSCERSPGVDYSVRDRRVKVLKPRKAAR